MEDWFPGNRIVLGCFIAYKWLNGRCFFKVRQLSVCYLCIVIYIVWEIDLRQLLLLSFLLLARTI